MAKLSVCCSGTNYPEFNFSWRASIARWSCTAFLAGAVWSGSSQAQQSPEASAQEANGTQGQAAPAQTNSCGLILSVDSEAELAGMTAHEIAHVAARHATRSATRMYAWDAISIPLTYFGGPAGIGLQQIAGLGEPLTFKNFSRNAENEADLLGIEYQYAAGYDPEAYVAALEKLQKREAFMHSRMAKLPGYRVMA